MKLKEQIANFFTLMNLVCGVSAIYFSYADLKFAAWMIIAGAAFDFADGFVARALKITSELGKQLDSLSDMVTFGVVPGLIAHGLLADNGYVAILIPVFSAMRLGKFNIDSRQTKDFIGLPTPANALFWAALAFISRDMEMLAGIVASKGAATDFFSKFFLLLTNQAFLLPAVVVTSLLLMAPFRLMGMKFSGAKFSGNELKFALIGISVLLLAFLGFYAAPIILLLYILFSIIHFYILKRHEIQS